LGIILSFLRLRKRKAAAAAEFYVRRKRGTAAPAYFHCPARRLSQLEKGTYRRLLVMLHCRIAGHPKAAPAAKFGIGRQRGSAVRTWKRRVRRCRCVSIHYRNESTVSASAAKPNALREPRAAVSARHNSGQHARADAAVLAVLGRRRLASVSRAPKLGLNYLLVVVVPYFN
jgi:hypothetical protein